MIGACNECDVARADQASKVTSAERLQHHGVAQFYRGQIIEITDFENALKYVLDQINSNTNDATNKIFTDISVLLGIFEQANLVGFTARPFLVRRAINTARLICEGISSPSGHFLVWFRQIYNLMDTLFQTRTALSLFFHTVQ